MQTMSQAETRPSAPERLAGPLAVPERAAPLVPVRPAPVVPERDFDPDVLRQRLPPYKVVVHDNNYNTFDEVIRILMKAVAGMSYERALALANEIHTTGAAVPYVGPKEHAEAVAEVIRTIGIKVTVEPDA
jgi:ATP-dependent Clp protease adaptor protein ClpS